SCLSVSYAAARWPASSRSQASLATVRWPTSFQAAARPPARRSAASTAKNTLLRILEILLDECFEEGPGLPQVGRVPALREPAVWLRQQPPALRGLAPVLEQAGQAHRRP